MKKTIAVLPGDGIGPEIVREAVKVLGKVGSKFGHDFTFDERPVGGAAYDAYGDCLPDATRAACRADFTVRSVQNTLRAERSSYEQYQRRRPRPVGRE